MSPCGYTPGVVQLPGFDPPRWGRTRRPWLTIRSTIATRMTTKMTVAVAIARHSVMPCTRISFSLVLRGNPRQRTLKAVESLKLPEPVWKTCPWQPRDLVATGLRQWLRCAGEALRADQVIGMPSRAVDEAWHGLILCTARYQAFCDDAYGRFLHHYPEGEGNGSGDPMADQLARTVIAWSRVRQSGEECVLWDLDAALGVPEPWGIPAARVAQVEAHIAGA
jgi:hypothetical protein